MSVNTDGLNALANGIQALASLELVAAIGTSEIATATVTYDTAVGGAIEITGNVTLTIPDTLSSPYEITHVYLREVGEAIGDTLAVEVISTNNAFPNGGDLIVTSYEISVGN